MVTEVPKVKEVTEYRVACDRGEGGPPRVWLQIPPKTGWTECPYCDCRFVLKDGTRDRHWGEERTRRLGLVVVAVTMVGLAHGITCNSLTDRAIVSVPSMRCRR